jgi:DNA-binding NarL/FixJ family response regulator
MVKRAGCPAWSGLVSGYRPMSNDASSPTLRRRQILLVDDHPLVLEGLSRLINQQDDLHVCDWAQDGRDAFKKIATAEPDLVVVDLTLQAGAGLELIKDIQKLPNPPGVLVLSMHDEALYGERALRAGAFGYVMKSESSKKIIEGIRRVLSGQVYFSESFADKTVKKVVSTPSQTPVLPIARLGDRELFVFRLIGQGYETRKIAHEAGISQKTVQAHCEHIKAKLGIENANALLRQAVIWVENEGKGMNRPAVDT